jgi:hypothetical protein
MSIFTDYAKRLLEPELSLLESGNVKLTERIAELELTIEDIGWTRVGGTSGEENEFSREFLGKISHLSRIMYLKNPLVKRGVSVKTNYIWGQGISVKAKDPEIDKVIQQFMNDRKNMVEFTGHAAQTLKETDIECDGNVFLVMFTDTKGSVRLRSIPFSQITEIICNPEDAKDPWFYKRVWIDGAGKEQKKLYPAWTYLPATKPESLSEISIEWTAPVMHVKIGGFSDWKFGISEVYSAIDWAKAYKEFLEDWATITRAYARFAWQATTTGGAKGIAAVKSKLDAGSVSSQYKPPPAVGSTVVASEGNSMTPIKTAGATTTPEDGRRIFLMVSAAFGLPETFFGDASVGSLATAQSLDRPTELLMMDRQMLWEAVFKDVLNYVLLKSNVIKGKAKLIPVTDSIPQIEWNESDYEDVVQVRFPAIIEGNVAENVKSIVDASTTGLLDTEILQRLLLTALGETDIDQAMDKLTDKQEEPEELTPEQQAEKDKTNEVIERFIEKWFRVKK